MKQILCIAVLGTMVWMMAGCQSTPPGAAGAMPPAQSALPDSVFVTVDSTGRMSFGGRDIPDTDLLKAALTDSLRTLKKQGKVPVLAYRTHGDVLMGMRSELRSLFVEVQEALK